MALDFGASNRRIDISSAASIEGMTEFSVLMWIYADATAKDDGLFYRVNASNGSVYRFIYEDTSGNIQFAVWQTNADIDYVITNDGAGAAGSWKCVAGTFDTTNETQIYSGDLTTPLSEASYGTTYSGGSGGLATHDGTLTVGNNSFVQSTRFFDGRIAIFKHFSSRLTLAELIMQQYTFAPRSDMNVFMQMGRSGTTTQIDLSGDSNNGSITGATVADHVPYDFERRGSLLVPKSVIRSGSLVNGGLVNTGLINTGLIT